MTRWTFALACALTVTVTGCGKGKDDEGKAGGGGGGDGACPALAVTIDGTAVSLANGLAVRDKMGGLWIEMFNHPNVTCDDMLSKTGRQVADDEVAVRAYVTDKGDMPSVGIEAWTQMGVKLEVAAAPVNAGDTATICVPDKVEFSPAIGQYKDKKVSVVGTFTGKYCGARE